MAPTFASNSNFCPAVRVRIRTSVRNRFKKTMASDGSGAAGERERIQQLKEDIASMEEALREREEGNVGTEEDIT